VRRSGRAVECAALEMRYTRKGIGGSNPSFSAISLGMSMIVFLKVLNSSYTNEIKSVGFWHLCLAFALAITPIALWLGLSLSSHVWNRYQDGLASLDEYIFYMLVSFSWVFGFGLIFAMPFGIPAFYALKKRLAFKLVNVCLIAALTAAIPLVLLEINRILIYVLSPDADNSYGSHIVGNCSLYNSEEWRTPCGWMYWIKSTLWMCLIGMSAGAVFWALLTYKHWKKVMQSS
jgi:hypothetical protein